MSKEAVQQGLLSGPAQLQTARGVMGKCYHASQMSQALLAELVMSQRKQEELEGVGRPGEVLLCQDTGTV